MTFLNENKHLSNAESRRDQDNGLFQKKTKGFDAEASTGGVWEKEGVVENFARFTGKHLCKRLY